MSVAAVVAGASVGVVVLVGAAPAAVSTLRLHPRSASAAGSVAAGGDRRRAGQGSRARRVAAAIAGLAVALLLPGPVGWVAALLIATLLPPALARLEPAGVRATRARLVRDLPLGADLFAACVLGGADPAQAAEVVAGAVGGPLAERLDTVSRALRLGMDPAAAWAGLRDEPALAGWARTCARAASTGAPLGAVVAGIAEAARSRRRSNAAAAARRAAVLATLPLGLCFLPAFVLLGVVPLVGAFVGPLLAQLG